MALTNITKRGLWTIAGLVMILWSCLVAERLFIRQAKRDLRQAGRTVYLLKNHRLLTPASKVAPVGVVHPKPLLG